ncbi:hypothetical protein CDL12_19761 [Handroanthus impetiginosus]|uniref:Uncharacterized protein n=1 Tax=Handroanthus impetiginosus TaxID=429701 RepID=A0A2G9GQX0_9LAMI|nr:hypothetical protein CDL12_19761 [Handroanthus impetiginosus]
MLIKISHTSNPTWISPQHKPQNFCHNPSSNLAFFDLKKNYGLQILGRLTRLQKCDTNRRRDFAVYSGVEPGIPPSGPPPNNILSWIVAVAIGIVVPFISYKWGPSLKNKIENAMKVTEDVVEAVEKVAEEVEKVAEDISEDLPKDGNLRKAVDFVENLAEKTAKDAGAVDDFIDKVQEEEEKAESFVDSLKDESKKSPEESNDENSIDDENSNDQISNK